MIAIVDFLGTDSVFYMCHYNLFQLLIVDILLTDECRLSSWFWGRFLYLVVWEHWKVASSMKPIF